jgi:tetratricopeptide (TPR) repeat protein
LEGLPATFAGLLSHRSLLSRHCFAGFGVDVLLLQPVSGLSVDPTETHFFAERRRWIEAERLYRILMKSDPTDASAPFNLGNLLRASARNVEAEAALRIVTRADPTFADAWYNLSDLLDEQGRSDAAIECLRAALQVAPDYADAMFNIALLLQRQNQYLEAADYWRCYLAHDGHSEWAARARRSLKFCEMQVNLIASA